MKICVVAPSQEYLGLAGVRIRYQRIAQHLEQHDHELGIEVIDQFRSLSHFSHDAYLFSKCYDARTALIGRVLRDSGRIVGVDVFDDYFSQQADSRFVAHRDWLRSMSKVTDFFLCSTARMQEVVSEFLPRVPGQILNDPFDEADASRIATAAQRNLERALATRRIDVAWFGVGDNPHFAVGLHDLHAFSHGLAPLDRDGWKVRLSILTNRRALDTNGLARLRQLPVPWTLDEWTVEGERALLNDTLVSFIPVSAQQFSIAKSLNRAISALTAGTQVLSNGFPLYAALGAFVYDSADALTADLARGTLRLRSATVHRLLDQLSTQGDPRIEAANCARFLEQTLRSKVASQPSVSGTEPVRVGIVHGVRSLGVVHQLAQRLKHLSIGSPFSTESLNYDLRFATQDPGRLVVQLSDAAVEQLAGRLRRRLTSGVSATGRAVQCLDADCLPPRPAAVIARQLQHATRAERLVAYAPIMMAVQETARALFPAIELQVSEVEPPFHSSM